MSTCSNCGSALESRSRFCPSCGTKVVPESSGADPVVGRTLAGKYRVEAKIGEGSMGRVYLAEHVGLKKRVALKVLHPDMGVGEETLQRFQREGIAAGRFSHPNAIQIFDFDHDGSDFFLAMEYVEGRDLQAFLRDEAPLPTEVAVEIVRQTLEALVVAHEQGIVHRDLKPENIMVARTASGGLGVKVLDFGLSKLVHAPLRATLRTQPGRIMGTPLYMSPEQSTGDPVDHRSDLYSLGILLYEMLAGEVPFKGESITELLLDQITGEIPPLHDVVPEVDVPEELEEFLDRALQKDREERFQTAQEMLAALSAIDLAAPRRARPSGRRRRARSGPAPRKRARDSRAARPAGRSRAWAWAAALAVAVSGGAAALLLSRGASDGEVWARVRDKPASERTGIEARYVRLLDGALAALRAGDGADALAKADEATTLECRDAEALLVRARAYRSRGDLDTARADLREATRLEPELAAADVEAGWLELSAGDHDAALAHFEAAGGKAPESAEVLSGRGAVAYLRGDLEAADELLAQAAEAGGDFADARYYRGRLLFDRGDTSAAIAELVEAKRHDPRHAGALAALGAAYLAEERLGEAERQLRDALELDPGLAEVREPLAALLVDEERFAEARELLESGFASNRGAREKALLAVVRLAQGGSAAEARDLLEDATREIEDDPELWVLLGILDQEEARWRDALEAYDRALALDGSLALPHANRGYVLFAQCDHAGAARALEQAIVLDADDAPAHLALAVLYDDYLGRPERAAELFRDYRLLGGTDPRASSR